LRRELKEAWEEFQEQAQKTLQQRARLERALETAESQARLVDDIGVLFEFAVEDDASAEELREDGTKLTARHDAVDVAEANCIRQF